MNRLEIVNYILELVSANEMEKAERLIQQKLQELKQRQVCHFRNEITEIIKMMNQIDMEIMQFKFKKMQLARLCPEAIMSSLEDYITDLHQKRKQLSTQKSKMAKQQAY
ncbi:hypothetical protein ABES02_27630 [Neobacillus pocheonensis]|uniref:hypothetical protein n=1 Tax=Neobacillus pocheonensis TaxID=363869 RepID=UPI003D2DC214